MTVENANGDTGRLVDLVMGNGVVHSDCLPLSLKRRSGTVIYESEVAFDAGESGNVTRGILEDGRIINQGRPSRQTVKI